MAHYGEGVNFFSDLTSLTDAPRTYSLVRDHRLRRHVSSVFPDTLRPSLPKESPASGLLIEKL